MYRARGIEFQKGKEEQRIKWAITLFFAVPETRPKSSIPVMGLPYKELPELYVVRTGEFEIYPVAPPSLHPNAKKRWRRLYKSQAAMLFARATA